MPCVGLCRDPDLNKQATKEHLWILWNAKCWLALELGSHPFVTVIIKEWIKQESPMVVASREKSRKDQLEIRNFQWREGCLPPFLNFF